MHHRLKNKPRVKHNPKGFTLMEIVVVLAVFSITALLAVDLFLTITNVQRQVRNVQAVQSDARFALESIAQAAKAGTIDYDYYKKVCIGGLNYGDPCIQNSDCLSNNCGEILLNQPTYVLATRDQDNNQIFYRLSEGGAGDKIEVCSNTYYDFNRCNYTPASNWQSVTPPSVKVINLQFYIVPISNPFSVKNYCTTNHDCESGSCNFTKKLCNIPDEQPAVTIVLQTESESAGIEEQISLQTTVTSMVYRR